MNIEIGNIKLPLRDFVISRTGILGITKSGKTYGAKGIAEQLLQAGVPLVVFDCIGVWRWLKVPASSASKGFPVVVAGGAAPDLPLTAAGAADIVLAAIRENVSLVIDLYDPRLSKADWRRIVAACFRALLFNNTGPRMIILEEAAEYVPQSGKDMDGQVFAEVEKVVRMGGNVQLGVILINQRAQELNKSVLELCDNLVLFRQRGSNAIAALEKWLDRGSPETSREITKSLPKLEQGECWVWAEESDAPERTKTRKLLSHHPDRRASGSEIKTGKTADTSEFVARMATQLTSVVEQAKAGDPKALRARIAELEQQVELLEDGACAEPERVEVLIFDQERFDALETELVESTKLALRRYNDSLAKDAVNGRAMPTAPHNPVGFYPVSSVRNRGPGAIQNEAAGKAERKAPSADTALGRCARQILAALAQHGDLSLTQAAMIAGYAPDSGGVRNAAGELRAGGFVDGGNAKLRITAAGKQETRGLPALPTGAALLDFWVGKLGRAEGLILQQVRRAHPRACSLEQAAKGAGYEPSSGGVRNAAGKLRTLELVRGGNSGMQINEKLL